MGRKHDKGQKTKITKLIPMTSEYIMNYNIKMMLVAQIKLC